MGAILSVSIEDIAFGGEGVARLEDFVIFIPFVNVGEVVEAEIIEVKKRFARAKLVSVKTPSPNRVIPFCPYFTDCGGCQYQQMAYSEQLRVKGKQISDLLSRMGKVDPLKVQPIIGSPKEYGYRNRIMIRSQWDKFKQGLNIGFIKHDNRLVVDIQECKISEPELNEEIQKVRKNPPPKGGIKVVLRKPPENWVLPRDSFFQNNFFLLPKLVEEVRARIKESGVEYLVDAFCGVGFFSIELADILKGFTGVEVDIAAIKAAKQNAVNRGITNGTYLAGRTEDLLPGILEKFDPARTALLIDPPRTGCLPDTLALIKHVKPRQIVYISCHPATLARDLNILTEDNVFELKQVTPLDMFPQTQHVECVADLRLK
ncbi:MAG: methyltransferase, TrmA family [Verrucomicrobiales bacterium]|nr:methyltransferase, TrmA family [Verrucomicrobiales bacterium]